ncbi:MAG: CoA transferase [Alphaproteobacteria bacterium]|nr:CoA transferase [Alphaproteobacteria bacterium]
MPLPVDALPPAPAASYGLLAGTRVLDLTTSVAGPYATMLLADLGADVVKVERPGSGDDSRAWGPPFLAGQSLWFASVNRNKRSIALDYARPDGHALLDRLIAVADVLVLNLLPRSQAKLGLDPDSVARRRPGIVFVAITGFGLKGARAEHACYDLIAEGHSGVMDLTGEPDGPPQKVGTPAADLLAGMDAALATVAAIHDRARTGRGHVVDVALVDSMTRFMTPRLVPQLGSTEVPGRSGGRDSVIAIYQVFETADEPITLGLGNDAIWRRFWECVGDPATAEEPAWRDNAARRADRAAIVARIQAVLRTRPRGDWLARFAAAKVPAGPINRADQVTADPHLRERGLFYRVETPAGPLPQVGFGVTIDGAPAGARRPPPALGADGDEVLAEWLGVGPRTVEE